MRKKIKISEAGVTSPPHANMLNHERLNKIEICNECGKSVKIGSGLFINRVIDFDEFEERVEMNKPFPEGDYICRECEEQDLGFCQIS